MIDINKIYPENCLDTMARMADNYIDLTVTSPPYDNLRDYKGCAWNFNIFKSIAKEIYRVTKDGGVVVWVVGDATINGSETGTSFKQALYFKEIGFNLHDTMIYFKNAAPYPEKTRYYQRFEYMFVFSKGSPKTFNPIKDVKTIEKRDNKLITNRQKDGSIIRRRINVGNNYQTRPNVWKINTGYMKSTKDKIAYKHPAIFPESLVKDHIISWSNEDDIIYDCFMGSGTTAKEAMLLNRNWIGSEIAIEYCNIANKRIKIELSQMKLF